jgi:hypothetical protein
MNVSLLKYIATKPPVVKTLFFYRMKKYVIQPGGTASGFCPKLTYDDVTPLGLYDITLKPGACLRRQPKGSPAQAYCWQMFVCIMVITRVILN